MGWRPESQGNRVRNMSSLTFQRRFSCLRLCLCPPYSGPLHPQAFLQRSLHVEGAVSSCNGISRPSRKPAQPPLVCVVLEAAFDSVIQRVFAEYLLCAWHYAKHLGTLLAMKWLKIPAFRTCVWLAEKAKINQVKM